MCQIVSNNNLTRTLFLVKSNMRENWQLSNDFERLGNYDPAELFDTYFSIVCCQQYATSGRHIIIGGQPSTLGNKNRQTFVIFLLLKIKFPKSMYTVLHKTGSDLGAPYYGLEEIFQYLARLLILTTQLEIISLNIFTKKYSTSKRKICVQRWQFV